MRSPEANAQSGIGGTTIYQSSKIQVDPTLQVHGQKNVFALGDIAYYKDATPTLAGTAQLLMA